MIRSELFARTREGENPKEGASPQDVAALQYGYTEPDWNVHTAVVAAQPFFRYVVHDALAELGAADQIARLCRDWSVFLTPEATTWRETWEGGSYCHGWSSTPTRDLVVYTLGITPGEPGYSRVRVAPCLRGWSGWPRLFIPRIATCHAAAVVTAPAANARTRVTRRNVRSGIRRPTLVPM